MKNKILLALGSAGVILGLSSMTVGAQVAETVTPSVSSTVGIMNQLAGIIWAFVTGSVQSQITFLVIGILCVIGIIRYMRHGRVF